MMLLLALHSIYEHERSDEVAYMESEKATTSDRQDTKLSEVGHLIVKLYLNVKWMRRKNVDLFI